jgi:uncharacterized membrane protein YkvA (DUF1232 family)
MAEEEVNYLELFPAWLRSLGEDAEALGAVVANSEVSDKARKVLAGGLNYLFKSLDLIPDGIDDIGYLDDAIVLRVATDRAMRENLDGLGPDSLRLLNRLAEDADAVKEFLGEDFPRLDSYVHGLRKVAARGRSVQDILADPPTREGFLADLKGFARSYQPPSFAQEEKSLIKLAAFFDAKLPK